MVSRAVAAVLLIRSLSLTSHLGEVRLLRATSLTTRVAATWPIPVPEAIAATSTMVAWMTRAAAAKNAEVATGAASMEKEEEGTCLLAAARPAEEGTPSATSPEEAGSLVPEEAGTASTVAAAVSAAEETTRKPSAGVAGETTRKPSAVVPVPSALAALPRGMRPDARLTP